MNCNAGMLKQYDQPQSLDLTLIATNFRFNSWLLISFHNLKFTLYTLLSEKYISYKKIIEFFFLKSFLFLKR